MILSKKKIDFLLSTSPWKFKINDFKIGIKDLKDNFLNSFSMRIKQIKPVFLSFFHLEIVVDLIEIELDLIYLDLKVIEDLNDWQKNAQKFYQNCQIIRGTFALIVLKNKNI